MTQTLLPQSDRANSAAAKAELNYVSNLAALGAHQPQIVDALYNAGPQVQWIFARDGSLTAMEIGQQWWGGCSLPRRAGQFMFKSMDVAGVVACFLNPLHAAYLRVTLDLLQSHQAVIAIVPDPQVLWVILHCEDFSKDFQSHRLWLIAGEQWQSDLAKLFDDHPGLPTPSQFIRSISTDNSASDRLIEPAQKIFADRSASRGAKVQELTSRWKPTGSRMKKICIIAPSQFRLWNDAPIELASVLRGASLDTIDFCELDSDDPATASTLALAESISNRDATVTANLFRSDLAGILPEQMPLITWVTLPRILPADASAPHDRLLLADPLWREQAIQLGWPSERLSVASWPCRPQTPPKNGPICLIADTLPLDPPKQVLEYSSHRLLWEMIQAELPFDPFLIETTAEEYLYQRMSRVRVEREGFNKSLFLELLVLPAYQQAIARLMIDRAKRGQTPFVQLHGKSWQDMEEFAPFARGAVESRQQFNQVIAQSSALVHAWPFAHAHPIEAMGRPVIRAIGRTLTEFAREPIAENITYPPLSTELLQSILK